MRLIICLFLFFSFAAKANDTVRSYFDEGRDFYDTPLKAGEVIDFYQKWLRDEDGKIPPLTLQVLIPVNDGFIVHFSRPIAPRYFYMQIIAQDPESLIASPVINSRFKAEDRENAQLENSPLNQNLAAKAEGQEQPKEAQANAVQPLVPLEDILSKLTPKEGGNSKEETPKNTLAENDNQNNSQPEAQPISKPSQPENSTENQENAPSSQSLAEDAAQNEPNSTAEQPAQPLPESSAPAQLSLLPTSQPNVEELTQAEALSDTILDLFPHFEQRDFQRNPLSLAEVDDIYKSYQGRLSPSVRARYQGAAYDEKQQNIILTFKGGLSGKLFHHIITPSRPNSLIIEQE